jgi:uncharacterized protein YukJ
VRSVRSMPLSGYGVLTGTVVDRRREGGGDSPHFQLHMADGSGTHYRIAVNVLSAVAPSELLFLAVEDFQHPVTAATEALGPGWHALAPGPGGANLDFVRGNLFDHTTMRTLPPEVAGPDNDLADLLDHYAQRAIGDPTVQLSVFGQRWGPESGKKDKVFGFEPGNGVHDVHMNQGNVGDFVGDDGVHQDGGLLLHLPGESRWVAIFLAFQSQAWHTDDTTGHTIGGVTPADEAEVRILAAMVNPVGPAPEQESVLLLNASPAAVDLSGWTIADRAQRTCPVPAGPLAAGATARVVLAGGVQLGNSGGTITLLDAAGLKVSGVAYTGDQAHREGWTITF